MKKSVLMILSCVLLFSVGCSNSANQVVAPQNAVEYGYFYYPNTDWGMTVDEVKSSLNVKDDEFVLVEQNEDIITPIQVYEAKQNFMGDNITAKFEFSCISMSKNTTLRSVTLVYPDDIKAEKFEGICEDIDKLVVKQGIEVAGGGITKENAIKVDGSDELQWFNEINDVDLGDDIVFQRSTYKIWSVADMTTVPQALRDSYNAVSVRLIDEAKPLNPPKNYKTNDFTQSFKENLCRVSAAYTCDIATNKVECQVTISGHAIAQMYEYADIYSVAE